MKILVFNCGSSSVKFQLIETAGDASATNRDRKLVWGLVDGLGERAIFKLESVDHTSQSEEKLSVSTHEAAVRTIIERLNLLSSGATSAPRTDAVGHRVVHGGGLFTAPVA